MVSMSGRLDWRGSSPDTMFLMRSCRVSGSVTLSTVSLHVESDVLTVQFRWTYGVEHVETRDICSLAGMYSPPSRPHVRESQGKSPACMYTTIMTHLLAVAVIGIISKFTLFFIWLNLAKSTYNSPEAREVAKPIRHATQYMLILPTILMILHDFMKERKNMALARLAS